MDHFTETKTASCAREETKLSQEKVVIDETSISHDSEHQQLHASKSPAHPFISFWRRKKERDRYTEVATQPSVFDNPDTAESYYPPPSYENAHRFDPLFRWTWGEEMRLVTKVDIRVLIWAVAMFVSYDLNRSNLVQANSDDLLTDLGMNTDDYNLANTISRVCGMVGEIPMQLLSRKVGIDRFMPIQMMCWGIVSGAQFFMTGKTSFIVLRALIELASAAVIPNALLYMTYFYTSLELPYRYTIWVQGTRLCNIISPLIAVGILRLRGAAGREGWRWLFLIEGIYSIFMGLISLYTMAPSITQTKSWLRPRGWFTEHEEKILVNRLLRDDPTKSTLHNRQGLSFKMLWIALCDYDVWPLYIANLVDRIPSVTPELYATIILRSLGFTTTETNLLTIPTHVVQAITSLLIVLVAEKLNQRAYANSFAQLWTAPALIALATLPTWGVENRWVIWSLYFLVGAHPMGSGLSGAWISRNSGHVATRNMAAVIYGLAFSSSFLISANIYEEADRPEYRRGNRILFGVCVLAIALNLFAKAYYAWRNRQRQRVWDAMSAEEKRAYLETHKDMGSKRLDFRFVS